MKARSQPKSFSTPAPQVKPLSVKEVVRTDPERRGTQYLAIEGVGASQSNL